MKKQKNTSKKMIRLRLWALLLFLPVMIVGYFVTVIGWHELRNIPWAHEVSQFVESKAIEFRDPEIPEEYIPVYQAAEVEYGVPWQLLAAHHRIETRFSTMDPLLSPVGAEGHMQFMPCTFVGWTHPTCGGLGQGGIPEEEKTDPEVIAYYGGYGVDGDGDGVADPYNIVDAVYSAANYLGSNGAAEGDLEAAIFLYNRSDQYVEDVLYFYTLYTENYPQQVTLKP
ncbi:lytic transglycosylase domain-containing protein [Chryseomicrobium sp. FSL W7-1435]|uniref:lytic transglycosylase domain-containing protein n=1 Tax=Chryseomicrobium sp. FSL W7-1435 TaxID=2921704 RepID=UPI00315AA357